MKKLQINGLTELSENELISINGGANIIAILERAKEQLERTVAELKQRIDEL